MASSIGLIVPQTKVNDPRNKVEELEGHVHSRGGLDLNRNTRNFVEPNNEPSARQLLGRAFGRAIALAGLNRKETGYLLGDRDKHTGTVVPMDKGQLSRWIAGSERLDVEAVFAVERLRRPFALALCEQAGEGIEIITQVTFRNKRHV